MSRCVFGLFSTVVLAASAVGAEPGSGSQLSDGISVASNTNLSMTVSPDGQAASIFINNLQVSVAPVTKLDDPHAKNPIQNQTAIETKTVTLRIPYATDQRSVPMTMTLRGYYNAGAGAVGRLVVCAGGTTKVLDVDSDPNGWPKNVEFTVQTHAAHPVLQITLFLVVEHDTDASGGGMAFLNVNTLDLQIGKPRQASFTQRGCRLFKFR